MPLTRLDNLISSKTGRYLYVSPDDFNASDELDNRGNSPNRPFVTIQRAFLEVARYSYLPGVDNDRFDEFTIMLMPGDHYIDNRPGVDTTSLIDVFGFDQQNNSWADSSVLDLSNSNNVLYRFNGSDGGVIVPRGCSLIGYDLRRTILRPLYVPDPANKECARTSIFNVTGGAYIWQFTIKDGDTTTKSPLYDSTNGVGKVYARKGDVAKLEIPEYSHHKITVFEYAQKKDLDAYYEKISKAFSQYQPTIDDPDEFGTKVQETRIVGPLSDLRTIESIQVINSSPVGTVTVNVTTKIAHGYIKGQYVAIQENGLDDGLNGTFDVTAIDSNNRRKFTFELPGSVAGLGLQNNQTYTTANGLSTNAFVQAEVDSVESASPYMFNLSIRSTWGICGLHADGSKASGFKSMVCAQYTGVSLQKDDRAFIRYDRFTNTWNQASFSDAFATVPYHTKGDAYWKDDWRNFHIRASNDSFVQCVSIFAVGFADHFLMESGGDMSITNSNSNFGNTSLHAIGHKGYAFNQDKGGFITDIIPPEKLIESAANEDEIDYYTFDVQASRGTNTRLYYAGSGITDPKKRPAVTLDGYRIGAKSNEKIFVELDPYDAASGKTTPANSVYNATLEPSGFKSYASSLQILNPTTVVVNNKNQDAANRIEDNKDLIAEEAYGFITTKYPALLSKNITITKCKRDIGYILDAVISDLRLGGNINTLQAAESYFSSGQLNYIDGELFETIEGFEYARDLAIAAMRNWDFLQTGCVITNGSPNVTVPTTEGLSIGMKVEEYTTVNANNTTVDPTSLITSNIPSNTYIKSIVNSTTIELGGVVANARSYLNVGVAQNATGTTSAAKLLFKLEDTNGDRKGIWSGLEGTIDASITTDTVYPECSGTANAISTFFSNIKTIINNGISPVGDRFADAHDLLLANKNWIADVAVKDMEIQFPTFNVPGGSVNCFDDIVDVIEAIAYNVKYGSNNQVYDAANFYVLGAHVAGEEEQSVYAFGIAKQIAEKVIQNLTYTPRAGVTTTYSQQKDLTITTDPNPVGGNTPHTWAGGTATSAVQSGGDYAHTFVSAVANGVTSNVGNLPNPVTGATYNAGTGEMVITSAGHGLTTSNTLSIADNTLSFTCTMDGNTATKTYPRSTDPSSGQALNISGVTTDTITVNVGGSPIVNHDVTNAAYDPATGVMVLTIGNHSLTTGTSIRITANSLTFTCGMDNHATQHTYPRSGDPAYNTAINIDAVGADTITVNVGAAGTATYYCANVISAQNTLFNIIEAGIDNAGTVNSANAGVFAGITKTSPQQTIIPRLNPTVDSSQFANRATLFTINAGGSNPHKFETGTPVRLVARPKAGKTPDERDVRLPIGFQPNRVYYVIAPGRDTQPFNYNQASVYNGIFDGGDQTKLMLANTRENAAAGIYIYSPETESIDDDVEILVQQYVLDETFDLHEYRVTFDGSSGTVLKTDVAHIFDKPTTGLGAGYLQKVFFRAEGSDGQVGTLPTLSGVGGQQISSTKEFYVRYMSDDTFKIFNTAAEAIAGSPEVTLVNSTTQFWYVFANKRVSPLKFDATFVDTSASRVPAITDGVWYLQTKDESTSDDNIFSRFNQTDYDAASGQTQTTDSNYRRLIDAREKEDRIYRLRYVQPKNFPGAVRKPNNGFVVKIRTDEKRNLLPQNIVLEPVGGAPTKAEFRNPFTQNNATEVLGMSRTAFDSAVQAGTIDPDFVYDPDNNPVVVNTSNFLRFSIRSAREKTVGSQQLLEVTAFNHSVDDTNAPSLKNTVFHTVKINSPQAGSFTASKTTSTPTNRVEWTGNSSGFAYIHAYFSVGSDHYLILKDVSARPNFSALINTRFTQGAVYADLQEDTNGGRDLKDKYLYVVQGANLFTLTPGDTLDDSVGNTYKIISVSDVPDIDDTFYIFDTEEIQERVAGQQDGIYYLTAVRGNITPLPRGAGIGNNFQNFKFSQPISSLYPLDYKNDPTWYQVVDNDGTKDTLITDPQETSSFADNYTHGLVYVNDAKRSMTKEAVVDLTKSAYFNDYTYTGTNEIKATTGNATSGSEQRKIAIAGDATSIHDQKVYIELRRPSIARSGNHTFEYLGFGPGNYSTGLPARQEVILSDFQDYYAQAKREDGGIVFYTGLNSNGDLYIGNRKIDAITGEEEFLERAVLAASEDDTDVISTLVTSFDTPVTFKDKITVEGVGFFNNRVIINTQPPNENPALTIQSNPRNDGGAEDITLTRGAFANRNEGDITIDRNKISAALFHVKGRGTAAFPGQAYSLRSNFSFNENVPSNRTPDQTTTFSNDQFVRYYNSTDVAANPQAGDILFKGNSVERSGSLGWVYANYYSIIPEASILDLVTDGSSKVRINWTGSLTNASTGIELAVGKTIRIQGFSNSLINGKWVITKADLTGSDNDYIEFVVANAITAATYNWTAASEPTAVLERSDENFKESGVIGAEALRTTTDTYGQFKLGVNTLARTAHAAHEYGFLTYTAGGVTYDQQEPRANLDVVGNAFISGKAINDYLNNPTTSKVETNLDEAFLVGGSSDSPQSNALFRVSTEDTRVGINVSRSQLTDTLTVQGTVRMLGSGANLDIDGDLNIDGGDITTNSNTFNVLQANALTVNAFGSAETLHIGDLAVNAQSISIGTNVTASTIFDLHTSSTDSTVNIGTVADGLTNRSVITIGGAFSNTANSTLTVKNAQTILDGDLDINGGDVQSDAATLNLFTRGGAGTTVNFATRASQFSIGGVAGSTTIRNSLKVNGDTDMFGDVTMHGGSNSGTVTVSRGKFGTSKIAHAKGSLSNLNVDFYEFIADIDGIEIISALNTVNGTFSVPDNYFIDGNTVRFSDTTGLSNNVDTTTTYFIVNSTGLAGGTFQIAATEGGTPIVVSGTPGTATGITLQNTLVDTGSGTTTWTSNPVDAAYTNLPVNNIEGIEIGDVLLINNELVQVVSPGADATTRLVKVTRGFDCTTVAQHNDNTPIYKLGKSAAATHLIGRVPQNSNTIAVQQVVDVTDTIEVQIGELQEGDVITFGQVGSITGVDTTTTYFVVNAVDDTPNSITRFNVSLDPGGAALPLAGTAGSASITFSDTLVALSEFGGQFKVNDYLRISGGSSCPSGEFVQITAVNDTNSEKFIVNNGINQDRFVIDSVFGGVDSTILGTQDFTVNLTSDAATAPTDTQFKIVNGQPIANTRLTVNSDGELNVVGSGTETNPKARIDKSGNQWLAGNLRITLQGDKVPSVDDAEMALYVNASSGDTEIAGSLSIDNDFNVFSGTTGVQFGAASTSKFQVDAATGDTRIGVDGSALGDGDLTVNGGHVNIVSTSTTTPSATDYALNITNLGNSADRNFRIRQDASIDAFGNTNFYNRNGGRRWDFINADTTLNSGRNYIVAVAATTVLTLPSDAETGDMIRFVEVSGALSYQTSLIIRAPLSTPIMGDSTGTNAGGLATAYAGGEMIVQTRNAGFGLVYMGANDGSGAVIPPAFRGWWLTEI